jgi:hypothetical protein
MSLRRRTMLGAGLALAAAAAAARAAEPAETTWDSLMPKDWDPLKRFRPGDAGAVADGSARANDLQREMREIWDSAPTVPAMNGATVRLPGYVVPLEEVKGELKEFLLVPYFGACIHSPPPPANQIVHVVSPQPLKGVRTMDAVWVSGTLRIARSDSAMGVSGYTIGDPTVRPYVFKTR